LVFKISPVIGASGGVIPPWSAVRASRAQKYELEYSLPF